MAEDDRDRRPPRGLASRGARPGSRYSTFVGLAFVVVVVLAAITALRSEQGSVLGADPTDRGTALPEFAVPEALGPVEGDANVFQDDCQTSTIPCPSGETRTPACEVDLRHVLRVCDFFDRPLVISFWFTRQASCLPAQDLVDSLARRFRGRVNFLSVDVRDDRDTVREIVSERRWKLPVGHDADGAVSNLYRVGGCPTLALAYPGGILARALIGNEVTERGVTMAIERLLRESRRRAASER